MLTSAQLQKRISIAYLCFLIPGACVLLAAVAPFFPSGIMEPAYFGFFVLIPLMLVSAVTISVAVALTFMVGRREPALIVLSIASMVLVVVSLSEFGGDFIAFNVVPVVYGLLVVVLEANWFFVRRKTSSKPETAA